MKINELAERQNELVNILVRLLEGYAWDIANFHMADLKRINIGCIQFWLDSKEDSVKEIFEAIAFARQLRKDMYDPEQGAWLSLDVDLNKLTDEVNFTFNWDNKSTLWDAHPDDIEYVVDMEEYPRPWALIPDWHPVRGKYTEQSWNEFLATR
ncbi:hypothetical protein KEM60_00062 [Austwickia sp. TVS 96-490-7B]|uniref:hypothetical protein n=1 Tax=Austwickia sp. TVS 96-490-7B TaxID=2830843 RepID=UPI001C5A0EFD|nr:hypothetical protein [Austwickia sp. TVS 96-490-7B]MBW3083883.1 hypothetical protein [Austwickia sp. TVS 96-490-7B]